MSGAILEEEPPNVAPRRSLRGKVVDEGAAELDAVVEVDLQDGDRRPAPWGQADQERSVNGPSPCGPSGTCGALLFQSPMTWSTTTYRSSSSRCWPSGSRPGPWRTCLCASLVGLGEVDGQEGPRGLAAPEVAAVGPQRPVEDRGFAGSISHGIAGGFCVFSEVSG